MINLTGKSVFVKTQEEYLSVLKMAKLRGFTWSKEKHLNPIEIPFPNILNFCDDKNVTYRDFEKTLYEASEIVEEEEKIKDAVKLVRTFAKYPDRTALTDSFIKSLKLLADTVESQMEELKQMERLTERYDITPDGESDVWVKQHNYISAARKLCDYEDLEEQGLLVRLPCPIGTTVWDICGMDIRENVLSGIECDKDGKRFLWANDDEWLGELNDLVFLTREEAEKKLWEMKNE